jgi:predicted outer membrane protein
MLLVALTAACSASLLAADPSAPGQTGPTRPTRITANKPVTPDTAAAPNADRMIATMLAIANEEEVALGKLVDAKSQNSNVRAFAERMIKDHSGFLQTLKRFGGDPGFNEDGAPTTAASAGGRATQPGGPAAAPENPQQIQPATRANVQSEVQVGANRPGHLDVIALRRQVAEQCLASARKDFAGRDLHQAELEYAGAQVAMHKNMLDVLKVLRPHASPDLQAAIDQATQVTQNHLGHARQLLTSMVQDASASTRTTTR